MRLENFYKNELFQYVAAAGLVVAVNGFALRYVTNSMREDVAKAIDYNHDTIVSDSEWNSVYQKLNLVNKGERGKDLQIPSLEKFLQTNDRTKNPTRPTFERPKQKTSQIEENDEEVYF